MKKSKDCVQIVYSHLSRCGCFLCCTKSHGRTKYFTAETADNAGACHGHCDDRSVCIVCSHFLCCSQKCENVFLVLWHNCNFRNVCVHVLHLAETIDDICFCRSLEEVVVGSDNLNACCVSTVDDLLNNLITCEDLYVDQIYISGLSCFDVEF